MSSSRLSSNLARRVALGVCRRAFGIWVAFHGLALYFANLQIRVVSCNTLKQKVTEALCFFQLFSLFFLQYSPILISPLSHHSRDFFLPGRGVQKLGSRGSKKNGAAAPVRKGCRARAEVTGTDFCGKVAAAYLFGEKRAVKKVSASDSCGMDFDSMMQRRGGAHFKQS